jgi:hypothetical protein
MKYNQTLNLNPGPKAVTAFQNGTATQQPPDVRAITTTTATVNRAKPDGRQRAAGISR